MPTTSKPKKSKTVVPRACQVQFARLFGSVSAEAKAQERSLSDWRRSLRHTLVELERYLEENVTTDQVHRIMLQSGIEAARHSLDTEDFPFGYIEGITRVALLLIGDYPDHRKRKPGRKRTAHYDLTRFRSLSYTQTPNQRLQTLIAAFRVPVPMVSKNPLEALREFRAQSEYDGSYRDFLRWYAHAYPKDYAAVF